MKKYLIALFIVTATYAQAQDSLYIYKGGAVLDKHAIVQIDSLTFSRAQDTLNIIKGGNVVFKSALVNIDSLTFAQPLLAGIYKDLDGNIYHTVTIGTQTWMLENLKTTKFRNGESIPNVTDNTAWVNSTSAGWCDYDNDPANGTVFGHLYNWYATADIRNIAPAGWHMPTSEEWNTLQNYLIVNGYNYINNTTDNKIAKSLAATILWNPSSGTGAPGNNLKKNNASGFTALPGGGRYGISGVFFSKGDGAYWWSSTEYTVNEAWYWAIFYGYNFLGNFGNSKSLGFSVRCIKSNLAVLSTSEVNSITTISAVSGGNITFDGNDPVTARGVCWNTTGYPTLNDNKTSDGNGTGIYNSSLTALLPGTTYYVRAYATNTVGTAYGNILSFTTNTTTPTLTTNAVSEITFSSATSGGLISSDGGANISSKGVCWSTTQHPTINDSKTTDGTGKGSFTSSITGLTHVTTYYVRAYATNSVGTAYGNEVTFTTLATIPTLTTSTVSAITSSTATSGGLISVDGGASVTARGVCWSTTQIPTIADSISNDGSGTGSFISSMIGLLPGTTYYVRAYAINSVGTAYGNVKIFTTLTTAPVLTTSSVTSITSSTAECGGLISSDGGAGVIVRGVCWSTNPHPTITDSNTTNGSGMGEFNSSITGLTPVTTYYIRAYATNSVGTSYGNEVTFTTLATIPMLTTNAVSAITSTTATSGGSVSSDGGAGVTERGVCWSTNPTPTVADSMTVDGSGTGSFSSSITGLLPGTTYYVRAYATNSVGTAYGNIEIFTTLTTAPVLTTNIVTSITSSTAECGGLISSDGGAGVIVRGVCWSTTQNPTIADSNTTNGSGMGEFNNSITGLTPVTTYYIRAYATNSVGTAYGNEVTFTTLATIPTLTTSSIVSAITSTTATSGGALSTDGGAEITAKGVCWSMSQNPTITDNKTSDGNGTGSFISSITGLTPGTTYYVRAYATNSVGTVYGNEINFATLTTTP